LEKKGISSIGKIIDNIESDIRSKRIKEGIRRNK